MMPKSTATSVPSSSTNRLPGCMSAEEAVAQRVAQEGLDHRAAELLEDRSPWPRARRGRQRRRLDPFERRARRARGRSQSTAGTRNRISRVFSAISESAAASSRRSISIATARRSVSTTSTSRSRAPRRRISRPCRRRSRTTRDRREAALDALGRSTSRRPRRPPPAAISARCTCAIDAAATGGPNATNASRSGLPSASSTARSASPAGTAPSCPAGLEVARQGDADHVRPSPGPELHIGGAEPGQRGGQPVGGDLARRPLDHARERTAARAGSGSRVGRPAEHALAREHDARAAEAGEVGQTGDHKRQPECSATMPPLMRWNETPEARRAHHLGEHVRPREAADRLHQVAIGLGVAGDGAAERRDHVERIEVVAGRARARRRRRIPGRGSARRCARDAPAAPRCAARCGCRTRWSPRRAAVGNGNALGVGLDEVDGVVEPALERRALAPDLEHVGVDVGHGGAGAGAACCDRPERDARRCRRRGRAARTAAALSAD